METLGEATRKKSEKNTLSPKSDNWNLQVMSWQARDRRVADMARGIPEKWGSANQPYDHGTS